MNGVAPVILGLLSLRPMSGYDMKRIVDHSTRFFWAASYGQIYPELRRLEADGPRRVGERPGGRARAHAVPAHRRRASARSKTGCADGAGYELRDLGLLKLFFAGGLAARGISPRSCGACATTARACWPQLREVEETLPHQGTRTLVLRRFGIETHEFWIGWLERLERELLAGEAARGGGSSMSGGFTERLARAAAAHPWRMVGALAGGGRGLDRPDRRAPRRRAHVGGRDDERPRVLPGVRPARGAPAAGAGRGELRRRDRRSCAPSASRLGDPAFRAKLRALRA